MNKKIFDKKIYMRIFSGFILAIVVFILLCVALFMTQRLHQVDGYSVENGSIKLPEDFPDDRPVYLNGEWEVLDYDTFEDSLSAPKHSPAETITFPIGSIKDSCKDGAYRIYFQLPEKENTEIVLAIPTLLDEFELYLNGEKQAPVESTAWTQTSTLKNIVSLKSIDPDMQWQELVIKGDFSTAKTTLFQRSVLLGTVHNLSALSVFDSSSEMFVLGIMVLVLMNGFVFMLFRPNHLVISLITIFDTAVMIRVFLSMNYAITIMKSVFPHWNISDAQRRSAALFFLMLAGMIGCVFSGVLFDPQKKAPKWLTLPPIFCYTFFALFFPFRMDLFEQYGSKMLIGVYVYTFVGVFSQFYICWQGKKNHKLRSYYLFQFVKTTYLGCVVFWDICFWTKYNDFSLMIYLYVIFFVMHVIIRLYDNNQSYHDVEILNQNLETTVQMRTMELSKANQILSELSVRDPLTNAFNRLYFEQTIEQALTKRSVTPEQLHLCIFDLDHFKRINDTYGHVSGDEMLKKVTEIVHNIIPQDVTFARIGGEEFVLVYEGFSQAEAVQSVLTLQQALEANAKTNEKYTTASFGIYSWMPGDSEKTLLKNADAALYEAKDSGRNRVVLYEDTL